MEAALGEEARSFTYFKAWENQEVFLRDVRRRGSLGERARRRQRPAASRGRVFSHLEAVTHRLCSWRKTLSSRSPCSSDSTHSSFLLRILYHGSSPSLVSSSLNTTWPFRHQNSPTVTYFPEQAGFDDKCAKGTARGKTSPFGIFVLVFPNFCFHECHRIAAEEYFSSGTVRKARARQVWVAPWSALGRRVSSQRASPGV